MKLNWKKIVFALIGIFLIGCGVSFNAMAQLGNDCIGIVYDGVRSFANLSQAQLGYVSNFLNWGLIVLLWFIGRRYVNIGTLIYILPYGFFVNIGTWAYGVIFGDGAGFVTRVIAATIGCLLLYIGVAIYITMDIGVDPFTGLVMTLRDKVNQEYRKVKIVFDLCMTALGFALGGKLGVITIITAFTAGPCIQFFAERIKKICVAKGIVEAWS